MPVNSQSLIAEIVVYIYKNNVSNIRSDGRCWPLVVDGNDRSAQVSMVVSAVSEICLPSEKTIRVVFHPTHIKCIFHRGSRGKSYDRKNKETRNDWKPF